MTEIENFVRQAEEDLRKTRAVSPATCEMWGKLPDQERAAFAPALAFLGCTQAMEPAEHRIAAARLLLLKFGLDTDDPRWSSSLLTRLVNQTVGARGGSVGDIFQALFEIFGTYHTNLSEVVANFIRALVVECHTAHRQSYDSAGWQALTQQLRENATKSQKYLAAYAVPPPSFVARTCGLDRTRPGRNVVS